MKILFITPSIPNRLHRIRSFEFIKVLSKEHEVHLLSLYSNKSDKLSGEIDGLVKSSRFVYKPLWRSAIDCLLNIFRPVPLEVSYCSSNNMRKAVKEIVLENKIDLIYIKRLRSFQFVDNLGLNLPMIIDSTDAMSLFYWRAYKNAPLLKKPLFLEEYFKYKKYERYLSDKIKNLVFCSEIDADYINKNYRGISAFVIPNVVDIEYFSNESPYNYQKHSILFSGLMNKFVNIEGAVFFVEKVFPKILNKYPDAKLYLVGPNPVKKIRSYQSKNIVVTGYVKDIREYIVNSEIVVCPIKTGTGVRNKILQAWSMKKPVVSTEIGWSGLSGELNKTILIANSPEQFIEAVCNLFENKNLSLNITKNGRELVESNYSSKRINDLLNNIFISLTIPINTHH